MILSGRYITALPPSNELVATVFQVHCPGVIVRVIVSGPTSMIRPSVNVNRNGHVRTASPRVVRRIEDRRVRDPAIRIGVAADDQRLAVRELRVAGTEQVA